MISLKQHPVFLVSFTSRLLCLFQAITQINMTYLWSASPGFWIFFRPTIKLLRYSGKRSRVRFELKFWDFIFQTGLKRETQLLYDNTLCAEITPLPALLTSLHISPGCVCVCVGGDTAWDALCVSLCAHSHTSTLVKQLFRVTKYTSRTLDQNRSSNFICVAFAFKLHSYCLNLCWRLVVVVFSGMKIQTLFAKNLL